LGFIHPIIPFKHCCLGFIHPIIPFKHCLRKVLMADADLVLEKSTAGWLADKPAEQSEY